MHKIIILVLILLSSANLAAQRYMYQVDVREVKKDGFYKIYLTPEISSKLQQNFPDVRIVNQNKEEIPFLYRSDRINADSATKTELNIIKNKHKVFKRITEVVVESDSLLQVDNFILNISNKAVKNRLKITGSFDHKTWYQIKKSFAVQAVYGDTVTELFLTNIPSTTFKYYKFTFNDYKDESIDVLKVYAISSADVHKDYFELPKPLIKHKDTLDKTIINLRFSDSYFIDKISFHIEGSRYYFRRATIFKEAGKVQNNVGVLYFDDLQKVFFLGSDRNNSVMLPRFKAKRLKMLVDNKDNIPIRIIDVKAYQLKNYLITYLKAGEHYILKFGNRVAEFPVYDLTYFQENIPEIIPLVKTVDLKQVYTEKNGLANDKIWQIPAYYLWIGVSVVGIILLLLTLRMLVEQFRKGEFDQDT